jgi:hypothetical protein
VHSGAAQIGGATLDQGRSYLLPAAPREYVAASAQAEAVLLVTSLPM